MGLQSRGVTDLPYWPAQNMYVYKEVWVHPVSRWLWMMEELMDTPRRAADDFAVSASTARDGAVTIRVTSRAPHTFALRSENLRIDGPTRTVQPRPGELATIEWKARRITPGAPWLAVVIPDGDVARSREVPRD